MRRLLVIGAVSLFLGSCSTQVEPSAQGAKSQEDLVEIICEAVRQKDVDSIMALGYWENVPEEMKKGMCRQIPNCFEYKEPSFKIRKMSQKESQTMRAHEKTYVWNMEPLAYLVIEGSDPEDGSLSIPLGVRQGQYHIATRYPEN